MAKHETTVVLKAEDKTKKALNRAEGNMTRLDRATQSLTATLGKASALLGIGAGVSFVRSTLMSADALAKASVRLGIHTDRLQELNFVASQSGIAQATLEMAVQRFGRRLGEAANDTGEAKDALAALGIETRNLDGTTRDINGAFTEAINKLGQLENASQRNALAMKLFDSEGVKLVQIGDNLDRLSQKARDTGLVLEQSLLKQAEETNDAWDKFFTQQTTRMKRFTLQVIRGGAIIKNELFGPDQEERSRKMLESFDRLQDRGKKLEVQFEDTASATNKLIDQISQVDTFARAFDAAKESADAFGDSIKTIEELLAGRKARAAGPATTLDALISSRKAKDALGRGDTAEAARLATQAAQQFSGIEEREGPQLQFGGFIRNQLAVAQRAGAAQQTVFEEAQKTLRLEIAIGQETKSFAFTEEGVKQAGKFASDLSQQLKKAEKTKNRTTR